MMTTATFGAGTLKVDAGTVAVGLRLAPVALRQVLHTGTLTSLCEKGQFDHAGRFRITFYPPTRRMQLVVDAEGTVLQNALSDYTRKREQPLASSAVKVTARWRRIRRMRSQTGGA